EVVLLDVLAVVAFAVRQPEQPLLQDRVAPVPERDGEAQVLRAIAEAADAVLVPAVGAAARVVVRAVLPRAAVGAVILPHRSPRAIADVGPPPLPVRPARRRIGEPSALAALPPVAHAPTPSWWCASDQVTIFRSRTQVA